MPDRPKMQSTRSLDEAYSELHHGLRTFLRRRLPNPDHADDLLQDLFFKAVKAVASGREIENLTGWLYSAARTTLADYYRAAGPDPEQLDYDVPGEAANEQAMHEELANCLRPLVDRLPALYRDTLIAVEYQGKTMREFASAQKVSISAVKSRVVRGRKKLRSELLKCCSVEIGGGLVRDYQQKRETVGSDSIDPKQWGQTRLIQFVWGIRRAANLIC